MARCLAAGYQDVVTPYKDWKSGFPEFVELVTKAIAAYPHPLDDRVQAWFAELYVESVARTDSLGEPINDPEPLLRALQAFLATPGRKSERMPQPARRAPHEPRIYLPPAASTGATTSDSGGTE
jgi:hypothetical protein